MRTAVMRGTAVLSAVLILLHLSHCSKDKQLEEIDKLAGLDGSFEIRDSGFSINWQINEALLKNKDAGLFLDKADKKDGSQSLKLLVSRPGILEQNPGISTRLAVMQEKQYRLSFWLKNSAGFSVNWKSAADRAAGPGRLGVVARGGKRVPDWTAFADTISTEPGESSLELEFLLTETGSLWIDNVMFEEIAD